jgi:hypothetical protein
MGRRQAREQHLEPVWITVEAEGETIRRLLSISRVGPNLYEYSISFGDERRTNLMPSTWHCEHHGKMDLLRMIEAEKEKKVRS